MADETTPVAEAKPAAAAPAKPAEKAKVVAPAYRDYPTIPALKVDSMLESNPYVAAAAHNEGSEAASTFTGSRYRTAMNRITAARARPDRETSSVRT